MCKTASAALKLILILCLMLGLASPAFAAGETYVIPIRGDIENGNWLFVERSYKQAQAAQASAIIFEIDTYGGYIDSAISMADLILASSVPTYCFVDNKAISAGSVIALAGETLIMTSSATMGAAEPRILGEAVDEKVVSLWAGKLRAVAETRGRDGEIAAAFADADIRIKGITTPGKLLTLTSSEAIEYGMADDVLVNRAELIEKYGLSPAVVEMEKTLQEQAAGWLSDPWISGILLTVGIAGVVIEVLSAGSFGVFGASGLVSFALYFMGHFWVGNIGIGAILLFAVGLVLIVLEIFVLPGFGVPGILGILAMLTSLVLASPNFNQAVITLFCSLLVAILIIFITLRNKKTRKVWSKLILSQKQENSDGYVSHSENLTDFMGKRGKALTPLRPAGSAEIEGHRVDVVTSGEFINSGSTVEVMLVEGTRVVVRELK